MNNILDNLFYKEKLGIDNKTTAFVHLYLYKNIFINWLNWCLLHNLKPINTTVLNNQIKIGCLNAIIMILQMF